MSDEKSFLLAAEKTDPALRPFFKDRDAALDAVYRTLAVIDYTWAYRAAGAACSPREKRQVLLSSPDGLFADPKTGEVSPWLSRLLGPVAAGKTAVDALERASSATKLSEDDYERLRARVHGLSAELADDKSGNLGRAALYCERAGAYAALAAAHEAGAALTRAGRSSSIDPADSVLLLAAREGGTLSIMGAAAVVAGPNGPAALADARLALDAATGKPKPGLLLLARRGKEISAPVAFAPERWDAALGVVEGAAPVGVPVLEMAESVPAQGDLVRAYGPLDLAGLWTETEGLVTQAGPEGFQTDAAAGSLMAGGAVVDGDGRFAGLLVLRLATTAEGSALEWPRALSAPLLRRWLSGEAAEESSSRVPLAGVGTGAIIGARSISAGRNVVDCYGSTYYDSTMGPMRTTCAANCGCASSSASSSSDSSYGSAGAAGAEMGAALGQALAPILTEGVKLLFRGMGSLLKPRPRMHVAQAPAATSAPTPPPILVAPPKTAPPRPKPRCALVTLSAPMVVGMESFALSVELECDDASVLLANHTVSFAFEWDGKKSTETAAVITDENGRATLGLRIIRDMTVVERVESFAERSQRDLDSYDPDKEVPEYTSGTIGEAAASAAPLSVGRDIGSVEASTAVTTTVGLDGAVLCAGHVLALVGRGATLRATATITLGPAASTALVVVAAQTVFDIGWDIGTVAEGKISAIQRGLRQYDGEEDCETARPWQLEAARIRHAHSFKDEWGAKPNSRFDICACKDGSIVIKGHGNCGRPGPAIVTNLRWR